MPLPPSSGSGPPTYAISLAVPAFYILIAILALFVFILFTLRARTSSKRAMDGFLEATGIDIAFIGGSVLLVAWLAFRFPTGNHLAWATAGVVLDGYWLTFAIPVVTVGNSVHQKTRGSVAWRESSIGVAFLMFGIFLYLTYFYGGV